MLFVDNRESSATIAAAAELFGKEMTAVKLEEGGDFLIVDKCGHSFAAERKTADDLVSSLAKSDEYPEGRLRNQLRRMKEAYDSSCIVLEGPIGRGANGKVVTAGRGSGGWSHASVMAILYDLQLRFNPVPVMPTFALAGTLDFIRVMHNRAMRGCVLNGGRKIGSAY